MLYDLGSPAVFGSTGSVNCNSKPSLVEPHLLHFEGSLAGPDHPLQRKGLAAARAPAAVRAAHEQRTGRRHQQRQAAHCEAFAKREAGPLIVALHFFQVDAHHGAVRLVADEQLLARTGRTCRRSCRRRCRLADWPILGYGKIARPAAPAPGCFLASIIIRLPLLGSAGAGRALSSSYHLLPAGWPTNSPGCELLQAARAVPGALVVGVEHVAGRVHADAAGRANAAARGNQLAVGRDPQAPAAELGRCWRTSRSGRARPTGCPRRRTSSRRRTRDSRR